MRIESVVTRSVPKQKIKQCIRNYATLVGILAHTMGEDLITKISKKIRNLQLNACWLVLFNDKMFHEKDNYI